MRADERPSILVVDDNPLIVNILTSLLLAQDYHTVSCTNGVEALKTLEAQQVDVIICDVMMPQMDGYELHHAVRSRVNLSHIPFVFLTALGDEDDVCKGKEVGADEYIIKPFDPKQLLALVKGKIVRSRKLRDLSEERFDQYRRKVIHTLSHEFRTPLVSINTGTELLLDHKHTIEDKKTLNLLEAIQRGGQRLEKLVSDFMTLQQLEAGIPQNLFNSKKRVCNLARTAEAALAMSEDQLKKEGFEIKSSYPDGPLKVEIYEPQILDVLGRLIHNVIKFSGETKSIEIIVFQLEAEAVIEIRDRGIGIDLDRIKEATDVFGQLDRDKIEQQGTGLGLAICSRYVKINKGRLDFERRKHDGTTAIVAFPVHSAGFYI